MTATARQMVRSPFSCSLESCRFSLGACTMEARQHPKHAVTRVTISSSSPQGPSGVIFYLFSYHTFAPWSNFVGLWLCWAALPGALSSEVTWSMSPSAGLGEPLEGSSVVRWMCLPQTSSNPSSRAGRGSERLLPGLLPSLGLRVRQSTCQRMFWHKQLRTATG